MSEQRRWGTWDALRGFRRMNDKEVLAEMPTEALIDHLLTRPTVHQIAHAYAVNENGDRIEIPGGRWLWWEGSDGSS